MPIARGLIGCLTLLAFSRCGLADSPGGIVSGQEETEVAPHGMGNVYAPFVLHDGGRYRMWYGGQGRDGHDRIHLAESEDGRLWIKRGVVLDRGGANHVNDPSIVQIGGVYFLYYTQADEGVIDDIRIATSADGVDWTPRGVALGRGKPGEWDDAIVGRPSVLASEMGFRLWYDGRSGGERKVGHAISPDGIHWTREPTRPLEGLPPGAGAVDVQRAEDGFAMVYESREGTCLATSRDGIKWRDKGLWVARSGWEHDRYGHVTPHLFLATQEGPARLFFGAAGRTTWDGNSIHAIDLGKSERVALVD